MDGQSENMQVDLSEALAQDGQLILTNEDGNGEAQWDSYMIEVNHCFSSVFPVGISGMITLPVTAQMYHSLVQQQMPNNDNTVCVTPMQVQNFISSNNLCGSIANSHLNASTTYITLQTPTTSIKTTTAADPSTTQSIFTPKTRTIVKKPYLKKRVLNLSMSKPQTNKVSSQAELRKDNCNNNSTNVRNRNQNMLLQKVKTLQTSQSKSIEGNDTSDEARIKDEEPE